MSDVTGNASNDQAVATLLRQVVTGAGVSLGLQAGGVLISYGVQIALARWLGSTEYGAYAFAMAWVAALGSMGALGFDIAAVRFIPQHRVNGELGHIKGFVRRSTELVLAAGLVIAVAGSGLLALAPVPGVYRWPLTVGLWLVPFAALLNLQVGFARAYSTVWLALLPMQILRPLALGVFCYGIWALGGALDARQAVLAALAAAAIAVTVQRLFLVSRVRLETKQLAPSFRTRSWISVAAPLFLIAGSLVLMAQLDVIMVGSMLGPRAAGLYGAAAKISLLVSFVITGVNMLAGPAYASLHASGDSTRMQATAQRLAHVIFWPSLVVGAAIMLLANPLLGLFGPAFRAARWVVIVLVAGQLLNAGAGSVGLLTELTGHQRQALKVRLVALGLNALLNVALIPILGMLGAALATATSLGLWNIWLHRIAVRKLGVHASIISALR